MCAGSLFTLVKESTLYSVLLVLFEARTCMVLSYISMYGVPLLLTVKSQRLQQNLTSERLSCMVMLLATAVAGFGNMMVLEYSIRNIAGSVLVIGLALAGGAGLSAQWALLLGWLWGSVMAMQPWLYPCIPWRCCGRSISGAREVGCYCRIHFGSVITILYFGQSQ